MKTFNNIYNDIISLENLLLAWDKFKSGKRKKADVMKFEFRLEKKLISLYQYLKSEEYIHNSYHDFHIHDPKKRHIHKACVRDRIVHQALFSIVNPIFEETFIPTSYSCRVGKGVHKAVSDLQSAILKVSKNGTRSCFALKCDIKKCFDSIDHDILLKLIARRIKCEKTINLIKSILDSFNVSGDKGLPLGNVTS